MLCAVAIALSFSKQPYSFHASFVEGCSCKDICVTEITGRDAGCHGVAAMRFEQGAYAGRSFAGTSAAWAWDSGKWVRLYLDAPSGKRQVLATFMKAMLADWGKLESVSSSNISLTASANFCSAKSQDLSIRVTPIFGGDGKTAVVHTNLTSPFHTMLMQGETAHAEYLHADHDFVLDKTNGFYNPNCVMRGKI
jgi:hypothetical protein